jgi:hypothetical protein
MSFGLLQERPGSIALGMVARRSRLPAALQADSDERRLWPPCPSRHELPFFGEVS